MGLEGGDRRGGIRVASGVCARAAPKSATFREKGTEGWGGIRG